MKLAELAAGEAVHRYKKSIVVSFPGRRRVLSTAPYNGGYREDLTAVFNQDATVAVGMSCPMRAPTYAAHMEIIARELGLDSAHAAGLSTAASMEHASIRTERDDSLTVTAIVTGGIEHNGGRVGDPAPWDERKSRDATHGKQGTINCMVLFNVDLTEGVLTRALVTATEAKTAVLQELLCASRYSMGLATGSGTDGTILVANRESPIQLTDTGKHSKCGELIGRAVGAAVREALFLQTELCPKLQHDAVRRMERFGLSHDLLWENYTGALSRARFEERMEQVLSRDRLVTETSLYAHLLDQLMWGMLREAEVREAAEQLLRQMTESALRAQAAASAEHEDVREPNRNTSAALREAGDRDISGLCLPPLPAGAAVREDTLRELILSYIRVLLGMLTE